VCKPIQASEKRIHLRNRPISLSMKPLLKWVGGKTQILQDVLAEFPRTMENYFEPFLGGASVLLGVLSSDIHVKGGIYASDVNPTLINFYTIVKEKPHHLYTCFNALLNEYNSSDDKEGFYYKMRSMFNQMPKDGPEHAATFFFLNKTCFRGVYREGPSGFNVPFGHYKGSPVLDKSHLLEVSEAFQRVTFRCQDFTTAFSSLRVGDFVYVDPPYVPESATSFVGYVADGFSAETHQRLFEHLRTTTATFVMSNSNTPLVCDAFPPPFETKKIVARRAIHSKDPSSVTTEVLVTNAATRPAS